MNKNHEHKEAISKIFEILLQPKNRNAGGTS